MSRWEDLPEPLRSEVAALRARKEGSRAHPVAPDPVGPGQISVWDHPRPPAVEEDHRLVEIMFGGISVARTRRAVRVCETASPPCWYLPIEDIRSDMLRAAPERSSLCPWKGKAHYWSLRVGEHLAEEAAWGYADPFVPYRILAQRVAFFADQPAVEGDGCFVDGQRVRPQPGHLGGWITSEIVGPFKGGPGTEGW